MVEENWHEARLITTSGISGAQEQERRGTSALLAVMSAVKEFGRTLTQPLGAPAGQTALSSQDGAQPVALADAPETKNLELCAESIDEFQSVLGTEPDLLVT